MEFLWAFLIFILTLFLTTILSGILKLIVPISYAVLAFVLGVESVNIGLAGLLGCILNINTVNRYIKTLGTWSNAPTYSIIASFGYITVFVLTLIVKYIFNYEIKNINYSFVFFIALLVLLVSSIIVFFNNKKKARSVESFTSRVSGFKIVAKYEDEPQWATYLYFSNGDEGWNKTIPGSFMAKDPINDLTFVFDTKEEALNYAKFTFYNAKYIEE